MSIDRDLNSAKKMYLISTNKGVQSSIRNNREGLVLNNENKPKQVATATSTTGAKTKITTMKKNMKRRSYLRIISRNQQKNKSLGYCYSPIW